MRVTSAMLTNQVVYNIQQSLDRYLTLQTSMSSGRRINNPSDDPVGILRDLDYRTELSKIAQFQSNVDLGQNWLSSYDGILSDLNDAMNEAKDVALAMSNDTYDEVQRSASASEIRSVFDRVIQLSQTTLSGRQMFSGHRTKLEPFRIRDGGVTYMGDDGRIAYEIQDRVRQGINITGSELFLKPIMTLGAESDLNVAVTDSTLLSDLNAGDGIDLATGVFTITDDNMVGLSATVDMTAPPVTTVGEAITRINDALIAAGMDANVTVAVSDDGNSLKIETVDSGQISTATRLSQLNSGAGIEPANGRIKVTNDAGLNAWVDLASATNVGDVIAAFNAEMVSQGLPDVIMSVNAAGTGLVIDDNGVPPAGLRIENADVDDLVAGQLGIVGSVNAQLVGTDLNPLSLISVVDTTGTAAYDLGLAGEFSYPSVGRDLDPTLSADANLADLRNGFGFDGSKLVMNQGGTSYTLDVSDTSLVTIQDLLDKINTSPLDITASINAAGTGIQITNDDPYTSFTIVDEDDGLIAKQMGLYGSSDMMGSMLVLERALRDNDQEGINLMLENFDAAMRLAQETRAQIGTWSMGMETTADRLLDLELGFTGLLADVEDADMTKVITELATRETAYQAALSSAASIIQPSLLDFLR
jgi:flagellar hook-associated protein 3 FlgL